MDNLSFWQGLTQLFFTEHMLMFKEINLSSNQLVHLPDLKSVQRLVLDRNKLKALPSELSELQQLQQLSVCDNGKTMMLTASGSVNPFPHYCHFAPVTTATTNSQFFTVRNMTFTHYYYMFI